MPFRRAPNCATGPFRLAEPSIVTDGRNSRNRVHTSERSRLACGRRGPDESWRPEPSSESPRREGDLRCHADRVSNRVVIESIRWPGQASTAWRGGGRSRATARADAPRRRVSDRKTASSPSACRECDAVARASAIPDGRHFDLVRTPANGFFEAMNVHVFVVRVRLRAS